MLAPQRQKSSAARIELRNRKYRYCQLKSLLYELGDFLSEVILTLLNAFALLKAGVAHELDGGADLLCDSGDVILDGDFVILDERLLEQADLLEVFSDATHDNLLDDGVGLLGVLRIFLGLSQADLLLLGDELLGDVALVHVGRVQSRDLHGDVLAELDDSSVGGLGDLEVDEHGDTAAHVDIGDVQAVVIARKAADLDVLADDEHLVVAASSTARSCRCRVRAGHTARRDRPGFPWR